MNQGKMKESGYIGIRFGLCCIFRQEPIRFRQVTAKILLTLSRTDQLLRLSEICLHNVQNLYKSLNYVSANGIGAFRILSPLFPRYTHPEVAYTLDDLPAGESIKQELGRIRKFRKKRDIRLSFHPDQFNVLSSPRPEVISNTMRELEYQGLLADLVDAEVINLQPWNAWEKIFANCRRLFSPASLWKMMTSPLRRQIFCLSARNCRFPWSMMSTTTAAILMRIR
jgi:UV DNA damage endonuclease